MILVTGGAGFIGSNFILDWLADEQDGVVNLDKLTYAGNPANLSALEGDPRYAFVLGDICDYTTVANVLDAYRPRAIVHLAAESHVDRSIHGPAEFIATNVNGTFTLLEAARAYWSALGTSERSDFRFLHVSTDEVYGSLEPAEPPFTEHHPYRPNSPYSASKAAADHLVRAYHRTYGLPTITTNCSNNYGPLQFPEKLIPLIILHALSGRPLPIYGDGRNVRDWLYVGDHCAALRLALASGVPGQTYNIGGGHEVPNIDIVHAVCAVLDELSADPQGRPHARLITYVSDRPGHDRRYAIDAQRIARELGWQAQQSFAAGLRKTVRWYLDNRAWVEQVESGAYRNWLSRHYEHSAAPANGATSNMATSPPSNRRRG